MLLLQCHCSCRITTQLELRQLRQLCDAKQLRVYRHEADFAFWQLHHDGHAWRPCTPKAPEKIYITIYILYINNYTCSYRKCMEMLHGILVLICFDTFYPWQCMALAIGFDRFQKAAHVNRAMFTRKFL